MRSRKLLILAVFLLALLLVGISLLFAWIRIGQSGPAPNGTSMKTVSYSYDSIDRILVTSGNTGETFELPEAEREAVLPILEDSSLEPNLEATDSRTGWSYSLAFYSGDQERFSLTIISGDSTEVQMDGQSFHMERDALQELLSHIETIL